MASNPSKIPDVLLEPLVRASLTEDLSPQGDITSQLVIGADKTSTARIVSREHGVVSGMQIAKIAFQLVDRDLSVTIKLNDGDPCAPGDVLMEISGKSLSILAAERVALNFAGHMTGIATLTAAFVEQTQGSTAKITCTRKTTPGLRLVEKQAVLHGGAANHRFSLSDAVLIKDNHIAAAGGIVPVLTAAKENVSHMMRVEIEVDRLDQLDEVLKTGGADVVLLDNMDDATLRQAVEMIDGALIAEASGNMKLERIAAVAATGVDFISVGALTHSAKSLDLGLDF